MASKTSERITVFGCCSQVLTALELARQARIAANRAFLTGLQLGPQAMTNGQVCALCRGSPISLLCECKILKFSSMRMEQSFRCKQSKQRKHNSMQMVNYY